MSTDRTALVKAAANLIVDGDMAGPDEDEYTRALCELIADGAGEGDGDKYTAWREIKHQARLLSLPIEPGLYQLGEPDVPIEHAVTYRLTQSFGWVNALNNTSLDIDALVETHRTRPLVRLVRASA